MRAGSGGQSPAIPAGRADRPLNTPVGIGGREQPDSPKTGLLSAQMEGLRDQQVREPDDDCQHQGWN